MKHYRFALTGMVFLFFLFFACPAGEDLLEEQQGIEEIAGDEDEEEAETEEESEDEEEPEDGEEPEVTEPEENEEDPEDDPEIPGPQAAVFLECRTVSENEIVFEFSQPVRIVHLHFDPEREIESIESIEEGGTVKVTLVEDLEPGLRLTADVSAEDEHGNTINEIIFFQVKNTRVPVLRINELRTEFATASSKAEFIEFKMFSAGNLGALRVFAAGNSKKPLIYEFAAVEVEEGEYVVLHLRTLGNSGKDEYGDLDESGGTDSSPTARDFWIPGSTELLRKTDAVYVLDQDDNVLDAVMITDKPDSPWNKYLAEAAEFLFNKGAWGSHTGMVCTPADAVNITDIKSSVTKSISRDETAENTHTAADWYVTATSGATPGQPNKPR
jgi:hypothetical protein